MPRYNRQSDSPHLRAPSRLPAFSAMPLRGNVDVHILRGICRTEPRVLTRGHTDGQTRPRNRPRGTTQGQKQYHSFVALAFLFTYADQSHAGQTMIGLQTCPRRTEPCTRRTDQPSSCIELMNKCPPSPIGAIGAVSVRLLPGPSSCAVRALSNHGVAGPNLQTNSWSNGHKVSGKWDVGYSARYPSSGVR